ncbi:MAG TPA: hypothetical protein VIY27_03240, partial [Myxococcota bacterium]
GITFALVTAVGIALAHPGRAGVECGPGTFDSDCDNIADAVDNCLMVPNGTVGQPAGAIAAQCDTDGDGYGNACDPDISNDGIVGGPDYGPVTANFGGVPGPSGLSCAGTIPCP